MGRDADPRKLALVRTKLEEACFFAKKAMAESPENQANSPDLPRKADPPPPTPMPGSGRVVPLP